MEIYIVFTNNNGQYYIEETGLDRENLLSNWEIEKEMDNAFWDDVQTELSNPSISNNKQLLVADFSK
ncbi:hypothetical protein WKH56_19565 [Priestia sp. SB1]|uniref:hypothetical protein n=1 Tax=Priestia sp. SB1 TaxID=3132359 RepID=UPI0031824268